MHTVGGSSYFVLCPRHCYVKHDHVHMATFLRLVASFAWLLLAGAQTQNPKQILTLHPLTSWRHFCVTSMLSRRLLQPHLHRNSSCSSLNCHPHPRASLYPCQTKLWKRQNRLPSPRRQRKTPNGVRKSGGTGVARETLVRLWNKSQTLSTWELHNCSGG